MLRRVFLRFVHEYGNGRAVQNAARALQDDRFMYERVDALARRLPPPAQPRPTTGVA